MRPGLTLAALAVVLAALAASIGGVLIAHAGTPCHAGASSVGPVSIVQGHVSGNFHPTTEVCLP